MSGIKYLPPVSPYNRLRNAVAEIPHLVQPERSLFAVEKALVVIDAAYALMIKDVMGVGPSSGDLCDRLVDALCKLKEVDGCLRS